MLENGSLTQIGDRHELLRRPRSPYVAAFLGINLFQGHVRDRTARGVARIETEDGDLWVVDPDIDGDVFAAVNPREITLYRERPAGSAQNAFYGPVLELIPEPPNGERVRVTLRTHPPLVAEVTSQAVIALALREDESVWATFKATGVACYPLVPFSRDALYPRSYACCKPLMSILVICIIACMTRPDFTGPCLPAIPLEWRG